MSKKILYIVNHMDWFWSHRLPLAKAARDAGYEVFVAAIGARDNAKLKEYGFYGLELNKIYGPYCVWSCTRKISHYIDIHQFDIVHAITLKYAFLAGLAARRRNVKVIHTIAGLGYLFRGDGSKAKILRALVGPLLKHALKTPQTTLIFQNPDDMALMVSHGFADKNRAVLIRGSGVDITEFPFIPEPKNTLPLIVFPTRLVWEKGLKPYVEMTKILQQKNISARCVIAGGISSSNPNAITEAQMTELISESPVEWLGHVADMPSLLAQSNLIVYPSWYGEGIPKVLLEAAAIGRAIITTDHPGCREAVTDGKNGLLVPVRDAEALAEAVEKLLSDPQRRAAMGKVSRKRAEDEFNVTRVVKETVALYS